MSTGPFACLAPVVVSCNPGGAECQFSEMFGGRAQRRGRLLSQVHVHAAMVFRGW